MITVWIKRGVIGDLDKCIDDFNKKYQPDGCYTTQMRDHVH